MAKRDLVSHFFGGFVRLHILHHADIEEIHGLEMIKEIRRHGYKLGPGTLYPILHDLEKNGALISMEAVIKGKRRKNYRITPKGRKLLAEGRLKLKELMSEVLLEKDETRASKPGRAQPQSHSNRRNSQQENHE
jgi:PadR family transcriptional regulator PadR